ncbi:putative AdoMet-dependent methyltransferase [Pseudomonas phage EM]|uniref:AdoMet-dependent methyltransferase n=1 Tax=Pseudomonas phage EM TaxID=2936914 RepID=A0AAE9HK83_9CAUD|nr:putative AdoMet-dependent methyltransferase [Pseudomonas phage EM]UPW35861.1 putative AdoMet-dependent methyltransferase [Pseudomonas phage EM]
MLWNRTTLLLYCGSPLFPLYRLTIRRAHSVNVVVPLHDIGCGSGHHFSLSASVRLARTPLRARGRSISPGRRPVIQFHNIGWRRGLEPQQPGHNRKAASGLHNLHTDNAKPAESTYGGMFRLGLDWSSYRGSNPEHQIESLAIYPFNL